MHSAENYLIEECEEGPSTFLSTSDHLTPSHSQLAVMPGAKLSLEAPPAEHPPLSYSHGLLFAKETTSCTRTCHLSASTVLTRPAGSSASSCFLLASSSASASKASLLNFFWGFFAFLFLRPVQGNGVNQQKMQHAMLPMQEPCVLDLPLLSSTLPKPRSTSSASLLGFAPLSACDLTGCSFGAASLSGPKQRQESHAPKQARWGKQLKRTCRIARDKERRRGAPRKPLCLVCD